MSWTLYWSSWLFGCLVVVLTIVMVLLVAVWMLSIVLWVLLVVMCKLLFAVWVLLATVRVVWGCQSGGAVVAAIIGVAATDPPQEWWRPSYCAQMLKEEDYGWMGWHFWRQNADMRSGDCSFFLRKEFDTIGSEKRHKVSSAVLEESSFLSESGSGSH